MNTIAMTVQHVLITILFWAACSAAYAQGQQKKILEVRIDELIKSLGSGAPKAQAEAEHGLFAIGEPAAARLREVAAKSPTQQSEKLSKLAHRIEWGIATRPVRMLVLGLVNYEDTHGSLPAAYTTGTDGKPLLSWRVELLGKFRTVELLKWSR